MATKTDARVAARKVFLDVANVVRRLERRNRRLWIVSVLILLVSIPSIGAAAYWIWRTQRSAVSVISPVTPVPTPPQPAEPPKDEGKKPEEPTPPTLPSPPSFGPGGSTVADIPFSRGDPNFAGIERRSHWTLPTNQQGWIPGRDLSQAGQNTPDVLWLQGGKAHIIRSLQKPSGVVELAFFYPKTGERTAPCAVGPDDLMSEVGFGIYPAKDAVLVLRWKNPTETAEPFIFQIDRSSQSAKEAMKGKTLCYVGIAP